MSGRSIRAWIVAPLLLGIGFWIAAESALLLAYPFWILAGILWAGPIAEFLIAPFTGLLRPGDRYDRPRPMYSQAESLRMQNKVEEAFSRYQSLAQEYPREVKPWVEMIRIAHLDMRNEGLAEATLQQGLRQLKTPKLQEQLRTMHREICSISSSTVRGF